VIALAGSPRSRCGADSGLGQGNDLAAHQDRCGQSRSAASWRGISSASSCSRYIGRPLTVKLTSYPSGFSTGRLRLGRRRHQSRPRIPAPSTQPERVKPRRSPIFIRGARPVSVRGCHAIQRGHLRSVNLLLYPRRKVPLLQRRHDSQSQLTDQTSVRKTPPISAEPRADLYESPSSLIRCTGAGPSRMI
jgi:hypothetical protein